MDTHPTAKIQVESQVTACAYHPNEPQVFIGTISGRVHLLRYGAADVSTHSVECMQRVRAHSSSCRTLCFSPAGQLCVSASADRSLLAIDCTTGKPAARQTDAHSAGIDCVRFVDDHQLASADENGLVMFWDTRMQGSTGNVKVHEDYIRDMTVHPKDGLLVTVSADGRLAGTDVRSCKVAKSSVGNQDVELLCVAVVKQGSKVVAGNSDGVLDMYTWSDICDCSDRWPGHPDQVDSVVKFDEDTIITGCNDGMLRALAVQPNQLLAVLGQVEGGQGVEAVALSPPGVLPGPRLLATVAQDEIMRFWSLAALEEDGEEEQGAGAEQLQGQQQIAKGGKGHSDDSSEDDVGTRKRRRKQSKGHHRIKGRQHGSKQKAQFFNDLL